MGLPTTYELWKDIPSDNMVRDVETLLSTLILKYPIMQWIPMGAPVLSHKHEWTELQLRENTSTLSANIPSHAGHGTNITITMLDNRIFIVGDQAYVEGVENIYQITAVNVNGTDVTATELTNLGQSGSNGNGAVIHVNRGDVEASEPHDIRGLEMPGLSFNYTEIFREDFKIARNFEAERVYGFQDIQSKYVALQNQAMNTIAWRIYNAVMNGYPAYRPTATGAIGYMGGLRSFIDVTGGNITNASGTISLAYLNDCSKQIFEKVGYEGNLVMVINNRQNSAMSAIIDPNKFAFAQPFVNGWTVGNNVKAFQPDITGMPAIPIIVDPNMRKDEIWFVDTSRLTLNPLTNRAVQSIPYVKPGADALFGFILGEYTLVFKQAAYSSGIIKGLTLP